MGEECIEVWKKNPRQKDCIGYCWMHNGQSTKYKDFIIRLTQPIGRTDIVSRLEIFGAIFTAGWTIMLANVRFF